MKRILILVLLVFSTALNTLSQDLPTIESKTEGLTALEGFYTLYWDDAGGKVWLEVDRFDEDFMYQVALVAGLGSNDIGLDRNQLGPSWVVRFERHGPKVFLMAPNLDYRSTSDNAAERQSIAEAFASGVIHGFKVEAQTDDRVLVDATSFIVRDAHRAARTLQRSGQGSFRVDASRSAPYRDNTKSFPSNTEMEALLTLTSDSPGGTANSVSAVSGAITLRQRHSFIELPGPGFTPRAHDPRAGYFGPSFMDYSSQIGEDMRTRFISRHRLHKQDPSAAKSPAVEPIVYYLDNGTPEPVRSALLDGARWWNDAFEAAGFENAFQVEVLPDGADPMDVRYNIINWTHRSTRGWSYGNTITDPRTGEIIKGHVNLGSLRVRQDYLLAEGLLNPYDPVAMPTDGDPMLDMALARIRQLSAHEIGHTLGIQHNFAASVNNRSSVMDYPAPLAEMTDDDRVTLNRAYDVGIGEWDIVTIKYGYSHFPEGTNEEEALEEIINDYIEQGWQFISDNDARPAGGAHPTAHLWDNGTDAVDALDLEMTVRARALGRFGISTIRPDRPLAMLEEVLVPLYLRHRYQLDAVAKWVGGVRYAYSMRGDAQDLPEVIEPSDQLRALNALIGTVQPAALGLPKHIRTQIPPRPPGYGQHRELFDGDTGLIFDPYAPAAVVAQQVFGLILNPQRAARLIHQRDFDAGQPGLLDVMSRVTNGIWIEDVPSDAYDAELQRQTQQIWTDMLLTAGNSERYSPAVRSRISLHLRDLHAWLTNNAAEEDIESEAHRLQVLDDIDRFLFRPYQPQEEQRTITTPPGSPIGMASSDLPWTGRVAERQAWLNAWIDATTVCAFEPNW